MNTWPSQPRRLLALLMLALMALLALRLGWFDRSNDRPQQQYFFPRVQQLPPARDLQMSSDVVRRELIDVIRSQLDAFNGDDYPKAYTYASVGIRERFPLGAFKQMVKTEYPAIANSRSAVFKKCCASFKLVGCP